MKTIKINYDNWKILIGQEILRKEDLFKLINKEIKRCKIFIEELNKYLKLTKMTNKEWLKGRIEECEYTIDMLEDLKVKINGKKKK